MDRLDLGSASRRTFLKTASLFAGATALAGTFPARLLAQTDEERLAGMRKQISGPIKVINLPKYYDFVELRRTPAQVREAMAISPAAVPQNPGTGRNTSAVK